MKKHKTISIFANNTSNNKSYPSDKKSNSKIFLLQGNLNLQIKKITQTFFSYKADTAWRSLITKVKGVKNTKGVRVKNDSEILNQ